MDIKILTFLKKRFINYTNQHNREIINYIKRLYKSTTVKNYDIVLNDLQDILKNYNVIISENTWKFIRDVNNLTKNKYNNYKIYSILLTIYLLNDLKIYNYIQINNEYDDMDDDNEDNYYETIKNFNNKISKINDKELYKNNYINNTNNKEDDFKYYMIIINDNIYVHEYNLLNEYFINKFKTIKSFNIDDLNLNIDDLNLNIEKKNEYEFILYYKNYYDKYHKYN